MKRGALIVIEGVDRTGKSTQARTLGLDFNWCKSPDVGLPKPDKVFFLTMPVDSIKERNGFGNERYEVLNFQKKVSETYQKLKEDNWEVLDANRSIESIQEDLLQQSLNIINDVPEKPIGKLWKKE